jgi:hypothetical protein
LRHNDPYRGPADRDWSGMGGEIIDVMKKRSAAFA